MYILYDSTTVRLVFRIVFTILFLYLGFLGSQCNKLGTKLRLLQHGRLPVPQAAGWLQAGAVAQPIWQLRHIPKDTWSALMVALAALSKGTDFATTAIHAENLPASCAFGAGMVLNTSGADAFGIPPWNGRAAFVAGNAQITSELNGCEMGIYSKVNTDINFCSAQSDILGTWECQANGEDITYDFGVEEEEVLDDLYKKDLLYGPLWSPYSTNNGDPETWTHLVVWSSSESDDSDAVFSIKASVDTTAQETDNKVMHSMTCTMNAPEAEDIAKGIRSVSTLHLWAPLYQGYMYNGMATPAVDDLETVLAWYLNVIIMVAGGSDYLLSLAPASDPSQGCLVLTTVIPIWLLALFFATIAACLAITALAFILWFRVYRHHHRNQVKNAPVDLWTWMAQAVAESDVKPDGTVGVVLPKDLKDWNLELTGGSMVRIEKRVAEMMPLTDGVGTEYQGHVA